MKQKRQGPPLGKTIRVAVPVEMVGECAWCERRFVQTRKDRRYCSSYCRVAESNEQRKGVARGQA